jgi:hypothetical protein
MGTAASLIFDTHAFVKRLTQAGMPVEQAKALADEHAQLVLGKSPPSLIAYLDKKLDRLFIRLLVSFGFITLLATGIAITLVRFWPEPVPLLLG